MAEQKVEMPLLQQQRGLCWDENLVMGLREKSEKGCSAGLGWAGHRCWIEESYLAGLGDEQWAYTYSQEETHGVYSNDPQYGPKFHSENKWVYHVIWACRKKQQW